MRYLIIYVILGIFGFSNIVHSEYAFRRLAQGVRNLGMGNVGIALSHDENALHYNPAGLQLVENPFFNLNIGFEVAKDAIDSAQELQDTADKSISDMLDIGLGKNFHLRFLTGINFVIPLGRMISFGGSYLGEGEIDFSAENPVMISLNLGARVDEIQTYGVALPIGKGHWVLGAAARVVKRSIDLPHTTFSLGSIVNAGTDVEDLLDGYTGWNKPTWGYGYDLGVHRRIEAADDFRITLGAVAQNIGELQFRRGSGNTLPKNIPAEVGLGISAQPDFDFVRMFFEFDIRDIGFTGTDDKSAMKRTHMGTEIGFFPIDRSTSAFAIRMGYNQGYFCYGFELNPLIFTRLINIQAAVYTAELGENPGDNPDTRIFLQLSFGI